MKLARDERGAMAVVVLVTAVCLVSALYYVLGIGQVVLHREALQDAADAAAFSAAVTHARGMNLIALCNMVMAALLAVLVTLRLVQVLIGLAVLALSAMSFGFPPAATAIGDLVVLGARIDKLHGKLKPVVQTNLELTHAAAVGLREAIPYWAEVPAVRTVMEHYDRPAQLGFALPARASLPTKDGDYDQLCHKSTEYIGDLAMLPIDMTIGRPPVVGDVLEEALGGLAESAPQWFCSGGDGEYDDPPEIETRYVQQRPRLPEQQACEQAPPEHARARCADAGATLQRARPDPMTGECVDDCGPDGPYAARGRLAQRECDPNVDDDLTGYSWQERVVTRTYDQGNGARTLVSEEEGSPPRLVTRADDDDTLPCEPDEWRTDGTPVCARELDVTQDGAFERVQTLEVTRVLSCAKKMKRHDGGKALADARLDAPAKGDTSRSPQAMLEGVALGDETFQVRALVIGNTAPRMPFAVMRTAAWGREPKDPFLFEELGNFQVAQAEYYFDGDPDADPSEWLWSMEWKARLRRYRPGASKAPAATESKLPPNALAACTLAGGAAPLCGALLGVLQVASGKIIH